MSVAHAAKPRDVQQKFIAAARRAWGSGGKPFWQDAKRMKAWVRGLTGVAVRDKGETK